MLLFQTNYKIMTLNEKSTDILESQQKLFLSQWEEINLKFKLRDDINLYLVKFMDSVQLKALNTPEELTSYEKMLLQKYEQVCFIYFLDKRMKLYPCVVKM